MGRRPWRAPRRAPRRASRVAALLLPLLAGGGGQAPEAQCAHEALAEAPPEGSPGASGNHTLLADGGTVLHDISLNSTRMYYYENTNVSTMNERPEYRKLIVSLEPCSGVVYLLARRTRGCWPNPHSCCQRRPGATAAAAALATPPCNPAVHDVRCEWTHFHSVLDGTQDGAPSSFEVPHSSVRYYIAVYAPREENLLHLVSPPRYRLTVLADVGAYPRPGLQGRLRAANSGERKVELSWDPASFMPVGVSGLRHYKVYSSLLLDKESREGEAVFLEPAKIMNSVCGLEQNAVPYGAPLSDAHCLGGVCSTTVEGVVPRKRYVLNVIVESHRRFNASYSGIIVSVDTDDTTSMLDHRPAGTTTLLGALAGTVFGVVVIGYLWLVKLYQ